MFTQKIPRQPTVSTSAPPTSGPRAMLMPTTPPQTPIARARSAGLVKVFVMMDMATGLSIEPPTACIIRNSTSQPSPGARLQSSEPSVNDRQAGLEGPAAADPVGGGAGQHQEAGQHQGVRVDGPLQAGNRRVQVVLDGRQRDVDDRAVQADDEQAHAADRQDKCLAPAAELAAGHSGRGAGHPCSVSHPCSMPPIICWTETNFLRPRRPAPRGPAGAARAAPVIDCLHGERQPPRP